MSTGIEVVVLTPLILNALAQMGLGLACTAAGGVAAQQLATAAQAAADALAAMHAQHQLALAELAQRQTDEIGAARSRAAVEAQGAGAARALAALTMRRAAGGTRQLLEAGLERLDERVTGLDPRPPELAHAITALRQQAADEQCDFVAALEAFHTLAATVSQAVLAQAQRQSGDVKAEPVLALLSELAELLASPLFAFTSGEARHAMLLAKYTELDTLAQAQPKLAQSLALALRTRVLSALDELAADAAAQAQRAVQLRGDTQRLLGCLAALEADGVPPAQRTQAGQLRERLAHALAESADDDLLSTVQVLLAEAEELYTAVEKSLAAQLAQAVVGSQVCDVLHGLGYAVEVLDEPPGQPRQFHVALSAETGMEVQLSTDGVLKSELVAYAPLSEAAAQENEKLVCGVVDELLRQLRERRLDVQERYRTHYAKGETPRVVARVRKAGRHRAQPEQQHRELSGDD